MRRALVRRRLARGAALGLALLLGAAEAAPAPTAAPASPATAAAPAAPATAAAPAAPAAANATAAEGGRPRRGSVERAIAQYRRALAADPSDFDAATRLGVALARLGRREEAEAAYRQAIAQAPARPAAYAHLADLLATDPRRWERRDEILVVLRTGLERTTEPAGRAGLAISTASFERSVGRSAAARARLKALGEGLTPEQRRRVLALQRAIEDDERARALLDWPEPAVPAAAARALGAAADALRLGALPAAVKDAGRLIEAHPGWGAPLLLRARALEASGDYDGAVRDLSVLAQLQPSHAEAWRRLGRLLSQHGGALDAAPADEALRQALALAPGHFELWLLRAEAALRQGRLEDAARGLDRYLKEAPSRAEEPAVLQLQQALRAGRAAAAPARAATRSPPSAKVSPEARALLRDAQEWLRGGDPVELAPDLIARALLDSPGFVEAAVTSYAVSGVVPEATPLALWDDGEALLELAQQVRALGRGPEARTLVRPWLDRAVALGAPGARFARGALRIDEGDRQGGLDDLMRYVASAPRPPALDEARGLLGASRPGAQDPLVQARVQLLGERPAQAAEALGGRCDEAAAPARLLGLGRVQEWAGDLGAAIACYREALRRPGGPDIGALAALGAVAARAPLPLVAPLEGELRRAAAAGQGGAEWALARLALGRGDSDGALLRVERFLAQADADDPVRPEALAAQERVRGARALRERERARRRLGLAAGGGALTLTLLLLLLRGAPLHRALRRRPALYPAVARAIAELRHDVLKHRTSVLDVLGGAAMEPRDIEAVSEVLWRPERPSALVAAAYEELRRAARARGAALRPLGREPIFGPLVRDLRRAEALVGPPGRPRAPLSPGRLRALRRLDERLRELHPERLGALLRQGPRTRLDPVLVSGWIRGVEAELRVRERGWRSPVLQLHGLDLEFPVEQGALATIFANLLRNAQAAVEKSAGAAVLVRVKEERDATGRRLLVLLVGDSAAGGPSLEDIEARESGRGLAIVRDLVHEWRGHLLLREEPAPFVKGVGACFPG